jgi:hypothetical protein
MRAPADQGGSVTELSVTDNCRRRGGDRDNLPCTVPDKPVDIAHLRKIRCTARVGCSVHGTPEIKPGARQIGPVPSFCYREHFENRVFHTRNILCVQCSNYLDCPVCIDHKQAVEHASLSPSPPAFAQLSVTESSVTLPSKCREAPCHQLIPIHYTVAPKLESWLALNAAAPCGSPALNPPRPAWICRPSNARSAT